MKTLIHNATIVNDGRQFIGNIVISGDKIESVSEKLPIDYEKTTYTFIDATGKIAIPGVIDDQVHFREPGLTHKGDLHSESRAAVAGGVTSFMDMPNTNPQTITQDLLSEKFELGAKKSLANFSFYMGSTNDNIKELIKTNPKNVCGIKVFMGASTGNMLVDNAKTLQAIFAEAPCLIATHCEDENTIRQNLERFKLQYGDAILPKHHPLIRSEEACYISSSKAIDLATKYNSQLHVLHLSTSKEISLFDSGPIENKRITSEVCVHHLWFDDSDYERLGNLIKWNPAIKTAHDRKELLKGLLSDRLDVIATDHAPHTLGEKTSDYSHSSSGGPMVQHSLIAMLELHFGGKLTLEDIVNKMCHAPAKLFKIDKRGFLRPGYYADIALVDLKKHNTVTNESILYKCKWSPFEGQTFQSTVTHTFVNGNLIFENGTIHEIANGKPLEFNR
ncbi:MAG: dihydroorotase [Salinivirgaceae bacterium]|jgi:dihydroorotase